MKNVSVIPTRAAAKLPTMAAAPILSSAATKECRWW